MKVLLVQKVGQRDPHKHCSPNPHKNDVLHEMDSAGTPSVFPLSEGQVCTLGTPSVHTVARHPSGVADPSQGVRRRLFEKQSVASIVTPAEAFNGAVVGSNVRQNQTTSQKPTPALGSLAGCAGRGLVTCVDSRFFPGPIPVNIPDVVLVTSSTN